MNERMLELYRQAQVPHTVIDPSNNMPYDTSTFSAKKFAELILEECAKRTEAYAYMSPNFIVLAKELRSMKTSV